MKFRFLISLLMILTIVSCRKMEEYFRSPDTEVISGTLIANLVTAYAANVAITCISGHDFQYATAFRSNEGFPCTSLVTIDMSQADALPFAASTTSIITVAGLWADENTGILTLLITDYDVGNATIALLGIETIPVIRHDNKILVAIADMDICLNPDQESILELDLTEMEINSELERLASIRPQDVYVAIEQRAYVVDINYNETPDNLKDDGYIITGGGQLVESTNSSAEIIQQAMVDVHISPECHQNPTSGMALIHTVGSEANHFPELGSVLLQFHRACDGHADVLLATGMYLPANGSSVFFNMHN